MLKLVAMNPEKIAEIKNSLAIISGQAQIILLIRNKVILNAEEATRAKEIIKQVDRIDKLLPQVAYKKEKNKCKL